MTAWALGAWAEGAWTGTAWAEVEPPASSPSPSEAEDFTQAKYLKHPNIQFRPIKRKKEEIPVVEIEEDPATEEPAVAKNDRGVLQDLLDKFKLLKGSEQPAKVEAAPAPVVEILPIEVVRPHEVARPAANHEALVRALVSSFNAERAEMEAELTSMRTKLAETESALASLQARYRAAQLEARKLEAKRKAQQAVVKLSTELLLDDNS